MSVFNVIADKATKAWQYCSAEVWSDTRKKWWVTVIKTLNICVKSFLDTDLQSRACALTYRALLAIVPALALLFAIGRGFGLGNVLQDELMHVFPAQKEAIAHSLRFVDSYLNQASEGLFVGIGILFLLWTLISLVSSIEDTFNTIWNVKNSRTIWRQITDYTAMFLILPVLMISAGGLSVMVSATVQKLFDFEFITPLLSFLLEAASWVITWLFFAALFMLIPNTKVKFKYAAIAGIFTGTVFILLQWLFVTGQVYVSKYNAIYGSFAFLPLLLIWMQLTWMFTLAGCLICYAAQNVLRYSFFLQVSNISESYRHEVTLAVAAIIVKRFGTASPIVTQQEITRDYSLPSRLLDDILERLRLAGVVSLVVIPGHTNLFGYQASVSADKFTAADLFARLRNMGMCDFIPDFDENFSGATSEYHKIVNAIDSVSDNTLLRDINIKLDSTHTNTK